MKQLLKFTFALLFGGFAGFCISAFFIVMFSDTSLSEFLTKLGNADIGRIMYYGILALVCFLITLFLQIILHELGHLLFGIATGYRFVSFRIGSFVLIKDGARFGIKRFSIAGTGGQCLLSPPALPYQQVPYFWYNAGGVIVNFLTAVLALAVWTLLHNLPLAVNLFLIFFFIIGFLFTIMNGVPMKLSGVSNDAYNIMAIHKKPESLKHLVMQLNINASIVSGIRLKDMPEAWFVNDEITDYGNIFQVSSKAVVGSLYIDRGEFDKAQVIFDDLMSHKNKMIGLLVQETACELLFLLLVNNAERSKVEELYTDSLKTYIMSFKDVMSSKQRLLCAIALFIENKPERAKEIYTELLIKRNRYLQQGEVAADLEIMENMLLKAGVSI